MKMQLTTEQKKALAAIKDGGDVSGYDLATILRDLDTKHPGLMEITNPRGSYGVRDRRPYFGARATKAGLEAIGEELGT